MAAGRGAPPPPRGGGRGGIPHAGRGGRGPSYPEVARVHAVVGEEAEAEAGAEGEEAVYEETGDAALIAGTVFISGKPAFILVDTGASHSFISASFVESQKLTTTRRHRTMGVRTPLGKYVEVDRICRDLNVQLAGRSLRADLTVLDMRDFDAILGMDWLTAHSAVVNCRKRSVEFGRGNSEPIIFRGRNRGPTCLISPLCRPDTL